MPVKVPAGAMTAFVPAAVINPLPLTVKFGIAVEDPKDPTLPFTVARVVAKAPADVVMSPVSAGKRPAANIPVASAELRSTAEDVKFPVDDICAIPVDKPVTARLVVVAFLKVNPVNVPVAILEFCATK